MLGSLSEKEKSAETTPLVHEGGWEYWYIRSQLHRQCRSLGYPSQALEIIERFCFMSDHHLLLRCTPNFAFQHGKRSTKWWSNKTWTYLCLWQAPMDAASLSLQHHWYSSKFRGARSQSSAGLALSLTLLRTGTSRQQIIHTSHTPTHQLILRRQEQEQVSIIFQSEKANYNQYF